MMIWLFVSMFLNAALAIALCRPKTVRKVIKAADFDANKVEPIAVSIRMDDNGIFLANPETGKKIEFTGCTAWSGRMAPHEGKVSIVFYDLPPWPGHDLPADNLAEVLLEHVPIMN